MAIDDCNPTAPSPAQASGDRNDDGRAPQRPAASPQGSPASPRRRLPSATSSAGSPRSVRSSRIVPGQTPQRRPGPYPLPNRSSAAVAQDVLQTFGSEGEELPFDDPPISEKSDSMSLDHAELRRLLEIRETGSFEDFPKVKTARLKYAEERVIDARATLDGAQRTLDIAQRTLESVQRTVDSARAAKDSARKTLDIARTRLDSCLDLIETGQKPSPDAAPLEVRLRRAEERYNEARSDFSSAEARLDAAISYVKDADSKLNDALAERSLESEKVIAELNKRIEALEKKLGVPSSSGSSIRRRRTGQSPFRARLDYRDSCCVVTGSPGPLEGCHIVQRALWKAAKTQYHRDSVVDMGDWNETYSGCYDVRNGVLLSRDIHKLFDDQFFTIIEKEVDGARTFELLIHESKIEWFKQVKNIENGQRIVFGGHPDLWPTKENLEIRRLLFEQHHLCHQDSFQTLQHDDGSEDPAADPLETHLMKAPFSIQSNCRVADEPATADCRTDSMESPPLKLEKSADWTETWVMDIRRQMAAGVQMSGALHN